MLQGLEQSDPNLHGHSSEVDPAELHQRLSGTMGIGIALQVHVSQEDSWGMCSWPGYLRLTVCDNQINPCFKKNVGLDQVGKFSRKTPRT